jgi:hypothetical protein
MSSERRSLAMSGPTRITVCGTPLAAERGRNQIAGLPMTLWMLAGSFQCGTGRCDNHFFAHLRFVRLLPVSSVSRWFVYILIRWILRRRGSPINFTGADRGANGTASRSLPRSADTSRCASAEKSHLCRGSKSAAPMLPRGAASAMEWKWRGGGGAAHRSPNKNAASL